MIKQKVKLIAVLVSLLLFLGVSPVGAQGGGFTLTILHNNDGESQLLNAGGENVDFGGVARFATLVNQLRAEATQGDNSGVVLLSSGDNFLAGPEFNASLQKGVPYYDSTAISLIDYDAMAIGNHEFDFGPDVLADFIGGVSGAFPFVSANLDFSGEPALQALVDSGNIVKSVVIDEAGQQIGVVGATTPSIPFISSPRNVSVNADVSGAIQAEIDALTASGINKIIVISHLQDVGEDLELAGQLSGVDVMIAGGGDELLANEGDLLVPGDEEPYGPYPLTATGADGAEIPVVTTAGDFKYVGRLVVEFDEAGTVTAVDPSSGLVRVAGGDNPDAVEPDPALVSQVVEPVETFVSDLAENVIATSEVALEGRRDPGVRTAETNEGNLMADALLWQANVQAEQFGASPATIALQNGGGIRNNNVIPAGPITELNTFDIAPFSNFVTIVYDVSPQQLKELMENAVSEVEEAGGRFAQIAGFTLVYDRAGTAQELDEAGTVVTPGSRVQAITLADGTQIVADGAVVEGAPAVSVATIDFLARGGDQYPFRDNRFTPLGVSYQQALNNYIVEALGGAITAAQYPEGGEGRITEVSGAATGSESAATSTETQISDCAEDYVVQADDWLSKIAEKFYGDVLAYPAIFEATNAAAAAGGAYAAIADPDVIEVGQVLCIPSAESAGEGTVTGGEETAMAAATFQEYPVTLENGVAGIVAQPNDATAAPAVLMLHGFASEKNEVGEMYKNAAAALAEQGIASLRIDFRGWGESAGDMADSTVAGQVEDAAAAYSYLAGLDFVDPARIGVLGFSLGGGISIISGAEHPEWYKSMVTWSSVGDFVPDFIPTLGQEGFDKAAQDGIVTIDLGWREVTLKVSFFKSLETYNLQEEVAKYPGALLMIAGSEDFSAAYVNSFVESVSGAPKEARIIEGGDHIYGVLTDDQTMANQVIDMTAQWFAETL